MAYPCSVWGGVHRSEGGGRRRAGLRRAGPVSAEGGGLVSANNNISTYTSTDNTGTDTDTDTDTDTFFSRLHLS